MSVSEYSKERLSGPIWLNNMDLLASEGELIGPWVLYGI